MRPAAGRAPRIKSVTPGLHSNRLRTYRLTIGPISARTGHMDLRGSEGFMGIALLKPRVRCVDLPRERAARARKRGRQTSATGSPPDWSLAAAAVLSPFAAAVLPGIEPFSQSGSGAQTEQPCGRVRAAPPVYVHDAIDRIRRLPYRLKGLMPYQIRQGEIESHLNEALAAKGLQPRDAMLVMVFRRAPVELMSHMRIEQSRRLLFYKLVSCEGLSRTRVYDLAAIRDLVTGKLHLIPHRTRNRIVSLS